MPLAQFEPGSAAGEADAARVLLLDEPTSSLDLAFQLETAALLERLNRERGTTIVVCTHDLNFAAGLCHELVLLREGRVAAAGPTETVLTPATIGAVYGVQADVHRHAGHGRLTVVPLARLSEDRLS